MSARTGSKKGRIRAHVNPLSAGCFDFPLSPLHVPWHDHYPAFFPTACVFGEEPDEKTPRVRIADIGCGFGGLLRTLSPMFPDTLILGMEIRSVVVDIVHKRIMELRQQHESLTTNASCTPYSNISVERTNAMKYLVNYFSKGQLDKMFFCFPDPHFKKANYRRRIISKILLDEYAYVLKPKGRIYCISDVEDLYQWMDRHLVEHDLFERVSEKDLKDDPCVEAIINGTDEGQKVTRNGGRTSNCPSCHFPARYSVLAGFTETDSSYQCSMCNQSIIFDNVSRVPITSDQLLKSLQPHDDNTSCPSEAKEEFKQKAPTTFL